MPLVATRKPKMGNLVKLEGNSQVGYSRSPLTVTVGAATVIGSVVRNEGDGVYSAVVAADTSVVITPTVENSSDYTISITAGSLTSTFTYASDVDATATEIVNGLIALVEADAALNAIATVANVTDTLVVTNADEVSALTGNLAVVDGLSQLAVVADPTIYNIAAADYGDIANVACFTGGPGASGAVVLAKEALVFSGAMTTAQIGYVVKALNAQGISFRTQV